VKYAQFHTVTEKEINVTILRKCVQHAVEKTRKSLYSECKGEYTNLVSRRLVNCEPASSAVEVRAVNILRGRWYVATISNLGLYVPDEDKNWVNFGRLHVRVSVKKKPAEKKTIRSMQ